MPYKKSLKHKIQRNYPDIHFHISTGSPLEIQNAIDQGIIDFGLLFGQINMKKYAYLPVPYTDFWGILMRRDADLAAKQWIYPEDLWNQPLIIPSQILDLQSFSQWLKKDSSTLSISNTYNHILNASLLVDEGLGYALCFNRLVNTRKTNLCFRPLEPKLESPAYIVWKKYQAFSNAAQLYLDCLQQLYIDCKDYFDHYEKENEGFL